MRYVLLAILFIRCSTFQPVSKPVVESLTSIKYIAKWTTVSKEPGVVNYKIQQSTNNKNWTTISTLYPKALPDSNNYSYQLPTPTTNRWFRVISNMRNGSVYYTPPIFIKIK